MDSKLRIYYIFHVFIMYNRTLEKHKNRVLIHEDGDVQLLTLMFYEPLDIFFQINLHSCFLSPHDLSFFL